MRIDKNFLAKHLYHTFRVVSYGDQNISLECENCFETIKDYEVKSVRELVIKQEEEI